MKIHTYKGWEYWYDRSMRCWYAQETDGNGNLIGASLNAYRKDWVLLQVKQQLGEVA